jgi:hypothetical protein
VLMLCIRCRRWHRLLRQRVFDNATEPLTGMITSPRASSRPREWPATWSSGSLPLRRAGCAPCWLPASWQGWCRSPGC